MTIIESVLPYYMSGKMVRIFIHIMTLNTCNNSISQASLSYPLYRWGNWDYEFPKIYIARSKNPESISCVFAQYQICFPYYTKMSLLYSRHTNTSILKKISSTQDEESKTDFSFYGLTLLQGAKEQNVSDFH